MRFKDVVEKLDKAGKIKKIEKDTSVNLEAANIIKQGDPLLFENVNGYKLASNIYTRENLPLIYGKDRAELREMMLNALNNSIEPKIDTESPFEEAELDLTKLPILKHYEKEGGCYITSGIFFAESKEHGRNLSYHRVLVIGKDRGTVRITHRDLWKYYTDNNKELDVAICIGVDPAVAIAGAVSLSTDTDEIGIAGAFNGEPIEMVKLDNGIAVPKDSEFVILGKLINEEDDEGPFVDMTGTLDGTRKQPVLKVVKILQQKDPVYHALLGAYPEHRFLMGFPKEPVIFNAVNKTVDCKDVFLTDGGINWLHCAVSIKKQSDEDPEKAIKAVLESHKSVKHIFVYDSDVDIFNPEEREWAMATRFQADKDLYQYPGSRGSSLDPSADADGDRRKTCKVGFDLTVPLDKDRKEFEKV